MDQKIQAMDLAIRRRDLDGFKTILDQNPDFWNSTSRFLRESIRNERSVTLLRKLAIFGFDEALEYYLDTCYTLVSSADATDVLCSAISARAARLVLKSSLDHWPIYFESRFIFQSAMQLRLFDLAERSIFLPDFDQKVRLMVKPPALIWDLPIHDAVAHRQIDILELLFEKGAEVDCFSLARFTPMMVAVHLIYPSVVVRLLQHGADPNAPPAILQSSLVTMRNLTKALKSDRGIAADGLSETGSQRVDSLTSKSDYILQLLAEGGLTHPKKRFIFCSSVKRHLSPDMSLRLKNLDLEVRSLKILALVTTRKAIRRRCRGVGFAKAVDSLSVCESLRKLISLREQP